MSHPPDLLVLAGEDDLAAVPVEGGGEDELWQAKVDETLSCPNIPHADVVVRAAGEEDVLGGRVPHHDAHSSLVEVQVNDTVGHRPRDAPIGDLPHLGWKLCLNLFVLLFVFVFVLYLYVYLYWAGSRWVGGVWPVGHWLPPNVSILSSLLFHYHYQIHTEIQTEIQTKFQFQKTSHRQPDRMSEI